MLQLSLSRKINSYYPNGYEPEALSYFSRMTTEPTSDFKNKVNTFISAQKANGLWSKKDVIVLLQAESIQAASLNMVKNANNATFVNSPSFTGSIGLTADTNTYVNTNYNPSTQAVNYQLNNLSYTIYSKTNSATDNFDLGHNVTGANQCKLRSTGNLFQYVAPYRNGTTLTSISNLSSIGIFTVRRTAAAASAGFRNGVSLSTSTAASSAFLNNNIFVGCNNNNGSPTSSSLRLYGYYEFGAALSNSEIVTNYNQIKDLVNYIP